ncbi:MAG: DUF3592 domain-containing protein [Alphaproteobacteria bacterium]|nr:DUF3592 domain-containing protein [Alphaproteobacteria bacterium]
MNAGQIALGLFTYTVLVLSALTALLLYLVEAVSEDFLSVAEEAPATVTHIEEQNYGDHDVMVTVTYFDQNRRRVSATLNDGSSTDYSVNQQIRILYNPEDTGEIKSLNDRKYTKLMGEIKFGALIVFLLTLGGVFYSTRQKTSSEERIKTN